MIVLGEQGKIEYINFSLLNIFHATSKENARNILLNLKNNNDHFKDENQID